MSKVTDIRAPVDRDLGDRPRGSPSRPPIQSDTRTIEIPIDHHPDAVRGDGPAARAARGALTEIHGAWTRIRDAAADPAVPAPRLAAAAQAAMERALTAADRAAAAIESQADEARRRIVEATRPRVESTLAADIRAFWREKGWDKGLVAAVQRDVRAASAVLTAPPYLSGLDDGMLEVVQKAAVSAHAAGHQADLQEATAALGKTRAAAERLTQTLAPRLAVWRGAENQDVKALEEYGRAR